MERYALRNTETKEIISEFATIEDAKKSFNQDNNDCEIAFITDRRFYVCADLGYEERVNIFGVDCGELCHADGLPGGILDMVTRSEAEKIKKECEDFCKEHEYINSRFYILEEEQESESFTIE